MMDVAGEFFGQLKVVVHDDFKMDSGKVGVSEQDRQRPALNTFASAAGAPSGVTS